MSDIKKDSETGNENISRESLIVPEEIFAPSLEDKTDIQSSQDDLEQAAADENDDEAAEQKDGQISFFDEDDAEFSDESKAQLEKSGIIKFEENDEAGYDPKSPRLVDKIFDFVELFALTIAAVFLLTTLLFRHAIVDGPSMEGTLHDGEHLIISDLFYKPDYGDVIVFEDFSLEKNLRKPIIKRVIALEGDTVRIDDDGTVFVNGTKIADEHKYLSGGAYLDSAFEEYTVPENHVFVLGDNRNNSADSRTFGAISVDTILGELKFRIFPFDKFGSVD